MMTRTFEENKKIWLTLPEKVRSVLSSEQTPELVQKIGEKHGLNEMEQGFLVRITGDLMKGLIGPADFVKTIIDNTDLTREKAAFLAQEINRDIFNSIKDALKEIHSVQKTAPVQVPPPPKPVPPTSIPSAKIPDAPVPPKAPNQPVRSEWGWHGKKNEATGKIEFQHESALPPALQSLGVQTGGGETRPLGDAHVGSVFEQKLGGIFRVKGDTTEYQGSATPVPPAHEDAVPPLHVPMKPVQAVVPPVRPFQPPKN